jgi:Eco57I restriction-modification methylase
VSFDQKTRNALAKMVGDARRILHADLAEQLQGIYGLQPDGSALDVDSLVHLGPEDQELAKELRAWQSHLAASATEPTEQGRRAAAFRRMAHEAAFTTLNRLAAIRMAEERDLVIESVRDGQASDGFRLFERLSGASLGDRDNAYAEYLRLLFDELAVELGVLFERRTAAGRLFPRPGALSSVLDLLDAPLISSLWAEDETIGWIYQYFNSKEERDAMRKASPAPRNSRELAVRNQFFTPRYVVEFLTDNTLGRLWYEMRGGATRLVVDCPHLVRRPNECLRGDGVHQRRATSSQGDLTQTDLLHAPLDVPFRPKKDPREIRVLDPAVGSGHFLLYAYDLLETIYEEAWADPDSPPFRGRTLAQEYPTVAALRRAVPGLILDHNLHGIDIDDRATQIAGMALCLRAQRSFHEQRLAAQDRPSIRPINIATAKPMPGEKPLLEELTRAVRPAVVGDLVREVWGVMRLAGELGSLLKVEDELRDSISAAKRDWLASTEFEQLGLFGQTDHHHEDGRFDVSDISDVDFWDEAEERVITALMAYATSATDENAVSRSLFAQDAISEFAFIDLCRQTYDVILMNPPFGRRSNPSQGYYDSRYPGFKSDMGLAFVERWSNRLSTGGLLGALSSRTWLAGEMFSRWRKNRLLGDRPVRLLLDLGLGVLDEALVETCAFTVGTDQEVGSFVAIRLLDSQEKQRDLAAVFDLGDGVRAGPAVPMLATTHELMRLMPGAVIAYWLPPRLIRRMGSYPTLHTVGAANRHGVQTTDDFQFLRLWWELPTGAAGHLGSWPFLAKGGEYAPFVDSLELAIDWRAEGRRLKAYLAQKRLATQGSADWTPWLNSSEDYFKPGLTFPERTASDFCPRALPAGCVFTASGPALLFKTLDDANGYLGGAFTRAFKVIVEGFVGSGDNSVSGSAANHYRTGLVNALPLPGVPGPMLSSFAVKASQAAISRAALSETSPYFARFPVHRDGLAASAGLEARLAGDAAVGLFDLAAEVDDEVGRHFGFEPRELDDLFGPLPARYRREPVSESRLDLLRLSDLQLVQAATSIKGPRRQLTKRAYLVDRRIELLSHILETHPVEIASALTRTDSWAREPDAFAARLLSYAVGAAFGRWDIRLSLDPKLGPISHDPFAPLSSSPPGMLIGHEGLADYPLRPSLSGIMVDDPGSDGTAHRDDIVERVRNVLGLMWSETGAVSAETVEGEACEYLQVKSLRDYFRRPSSFFAFHLAQYSGSRRQGPIYWPLSTASGSYTVWIYCPGLSDDLLYRAVTDYVDPKIRELDGRLAEASSQLESTLTRDAAKIRERLDEWRELRIEIADLRAELLRVAALPYRPDLEDGILVSAAPLHNLFRHPQWRKDLATCWTQLVAGSYDWSHLAHAIWPERVREASTSDLSMAIGHGLESLYVGAPISNDRSTRRRGQAVEEEPV